MKCYECGKELKSYYFEYARKTFCSNHCAEHMAEVKHHMPAHAAKLLVRTQGRFTGGSYDEQ